MRLSYVQRGAGKDLVMLHGYLSNKESFYPQIEYFSQFYRVTALDFLGMGGADALEEPFSVDDYADWTARALKGLNIENAHLLAHSFGGRVAVKLLSRGYPFDRVVLTGCAGIIPKRTAKYKLRVKLYRAVRKIAPHYAETHFGSTEYRTLSPIMRESYKKIVNEDLRAYAEQIVRPVLFLHGENDRETPLSSIEIYLGRIAGSELKILPRCGHFAFLDDPLAFNLAAEEFYHADN